MLLLISIEIVKSLESLWLYGYGRKPNGKIHANNPLRLTTDEEKGFSDFLEENKSINFDKNYIVYTCELMYLNFHCKIQ